MLYYLDNWQNKAPNRPAARGRFKGLNENYARELMELHTLGVNGGYTQQDVITLAHIFTGWGFPPRRQGEAVQAEFFFDPNRHDSSDKVFLGQTIKGTGMAEGEQALDILARHSATAHHISYKLAQYFVADEPPPSLVDKLAKRFQDTDGDIRAVLDTLGLHGWAAKSTPLKSNSNPKRLIVIFLRGAVDGLNVVIPHWESAYYDARPLIAIAPPNEANGALDLDGRFGLHPALTSLMPLWKQGSLAFVHACGSPDETRSHFDAQDYMESGTPGVKKTADGWMNRLLGVLPNSSPVQGLNIGETIPRILSGRMAVASLPTGKVADRPLPLDRPQMAAAFDRLYTGNDAISKAYQEGRAARQELLANLAQEMKQANNGAGAPSGFAADAQQLARLMAKDPSIELAFMALGGWDTHVNEGGSKGQLARNLKALGDGLAALAQGLGNVYSDTAIVVMSEFGRTVAENGNGGTDHGHGNVMWLLGGAIKGGKVYGNWPGLSQSQLYQSRDLAVTTDFRDVIAAVLRRHMQLNGARINQIFPNYSPTQGIEVV